MRRYFISISLASIVLAVFISLYGCGKKGPAPSKNDVLAYVNNDAIYKEDLKRDVALRARMDPAFKVTPETEKEQLDVMIDRKLIIQYAMEKGLAREERFVNTIKTIWEHTLIRDFIEYKKKELQDYLFATDDDIRKYYENMSYKVAFKIFKTRNEQERNDTYDQYLSSRDTSAWQALGPARYEDLADTVLIDAFRMDKGEAGKFDVENNYYIIEVADKEKIDIAPLEGLKPDIEKRIIAMKEKRLFEEWLKERKKKSKIVIKEQNL